MKHILTCVGTRPNLIKITQLDRYLARYPEITHKVLHTGQHIDRNMNEVFFEELKIRKPDVCLNINQGSQVSVMAQTMAECEKVLVASRPDLVMVPGDVNSSFACAFVAQRLGIAVAHIESGLRSFDMTMPEEANRILIDALAELLFVTEESGRENLLREGKAPEKIRFVGNTMIDSLVAFLPAIDASSIRKRLGLEDYYVLTFHRPVNVDDKENLTTLVDMIGDLASSRQIVFPVHPRTRKRMAEFALESKLRQKHVCLTPPIGYVDFLHLVKNAKAVITDSGGVQEETTFLGVPCITVRFSTERPVTVSEGTNTLVGLDPTAIKQLLGRIETGDYKKGSIPHLWDGRASERLVEEVGRFLSSSREIAGC